jgi:protein-tyrosine-phosphatase
MKSVLFVCTANMCRSPLAQGLFQAALAANAQDWRVESAGIDAIEGSPASQKTLHILGERGIDLSAHRARQIDRSLMEQFDLILVMEHRHKAILQSRFPQFAAKVFLLSEMVGDENEIADPVGGSLEDYRAVANQIESIFQRGFQRIAQLAQG